MKPLDSDWVELLPGDRARYVAELGRYREMGLADEHPLPARLLRRIATIDGLLAAIEKRRED